MPPAPITATVEPASRPPSCGSQDQARAYWLKLRTPASSSPSACSATCAAYAPAAVVNVTPGRGADALDPVLDARRLQLHPLHGRRKLGEIVGRADPDDGLRVLERCERAAARLDRVGEVLWSVWAEVDCWCHQVSCGVGGSIAARAASRDASEMSSVPQFAARGITKSFGGREILRGADLDVEAGSRIGILGPNGGGKSTLMRILAGLDEPDAGDGDPPARPRRSPTCRRSSTATGATRARRSRGAAGAGRCSRPSCTAAERRLADPALAADLDAMTRALAHHERLLARWTEAGGDRAEGEALGAPARARHRRATLEHAHERALRRPAQARRARRLPRAPPRRAAARRARGAPGHGAAASARRAAGRLRRRRGDDLPRPPPARRGVSADRRARQRARSASGRATTAPTSSPASSSSSASGSVRHAAEGDRAPGGGRAALPALGAHPRQRARGHARRA